MSALIASCKSDPSQPAAFKQFFADTTLRLDYLHTGNASSEKFEPQHIIAEGAWAGRTQTLVNPYRLGNYLFELYDIASNTLIYSEGFNTVFSEWQTIAEAQEKTLTFNETIRMPWPKNNAKLLIYKRDSLNVLKPIWEYTIAPGDKSLQSARTTLNCPVVQLLNNGDPKTKVDIVILGDGYTADEMPKFREDADFFVKSFFEVEPFKSRQADFNVNAVEITAPNSGIKNPAENFDPQSPLKMSYNSFGVDRYVITYDDWNFRDYAGLVPYDFVVILLNSEKYGGGGIYNLYITAAARSRLNGFVMVHEMGHHMAALADEYYSSEVAYTPNSTKVEPWEFNVTSLADPQKLKWKQFVKPGTPIPTPWNKDEYDRGGGKASLLPPNDHTVGAFEGANYHAQGVYRPEVNCIMLAYADYFCAVCHDALNKIIDLQTK